MSFWLEGEAWAHVSEDEHRAGVAGVLARSTDERNGSAHRRGGPTWLSFALTGLGVAALGLALAGLFGLPVPWSRDPPAGIGRSAFQVGELGQMTLYTSTMGLSPGDAPAARTRRGSVIVPPVCLAVGPDGCSQVEGFGNVRLVDNARPDRVAFVSTIDGPVPWRHYIAAVGPGIAIQPRQVRGHLGFFVPASGATGGLQFLQWDEPSGLSVIVSAPAVAFTETQMFAIANALDDEGRTVDAIRPVAQVQGRPAPGVFSDKSNGYVPPIRGYSHSEYLTSLDSPKPSGCLGLGPNTECVPVRYAHGIGYLPHPGTTWTPGLVVGIVPSDTRQVLVELRGRPPIRFAPSSSSGPSSGERYFAHWLPRFDDIPTAIAALNESGIPTNRVALPSPQIP